MEEAGDTRKKEMFVSTPTSTGAGAKVHTRTGAFHVEGEGLKSVAQLASQCPSQAVIPGEDSPRVAGQKRNRFWRNRKGFGDRNQQQQPRTVEGPLTVTEQPTNLPPSDPETRAEGSVVQAVQQQHQGSSGGKQRVVLHYRGALRKEPPGGSKPSTGTAEIRPPGKSSRTVGTWFLESFAGEPTCYFSDHPKNQVLGEWGKPCPNVFLGGTLTVRPSSWNGKYPIMDCNCSSSVLRVKTSDIEMDIENDLQMEKDTDDLSSILCLS